MFAQWICQIVLLFVMAHGVGPLEESAEKRWPAPAHVQAAANRDKTGTTTRPEKTFGSQTLGDQALASRVSFAAERTGFEPADQLPGHGFSKPALSTTQPPLRVGRACGSAWADPSPMEPNSRQFGRYRKAAIPVVERPNRVDRSIRRGVAGNCWLPRRARPAAVRVEAMIFGDYSGIRSCFRQAWFIRQGVRCAAVGWQSVRQRESR